MFRFHRNTLSACSQSISLLLSPICSLLIAQFNFISPPFTWSSLLRSFEKSVVNVCDFNIVAFPWIRFQQWKVYVRVLQCSIRSSTKSICNSYFLCAPLCIYLHSELRRSSGALIMPTSPNLYIIIPCFSVVRNSPLTRVGFAVIS